MTMFGTPQWAAEEIAERWPANPKGAFYMLAYGASPHVVDNVIGETVDQLKAKIEELGAANLSFHYELKNARRDARNVLNESGRRHNERLRRVKRKATSDRDSLRSQVEQLQKKVAEKFIGSEIDTFMGTPIADAAEAMLVGEELARCVNRPSTWKEANEIAKRFLKLRTPPPPKKVIRLNNLVKVEKLVCPVCTELANVTPAGTYFCTMPSCGWEGWE